MNTSTRAEKQLQAMDAIISMLPVIPFEQAEASFMLQVTKGWRENERRGAVLWCSLWEAIKPLGATSAAEKLELLTTALLGGWMPLWLADLSLELLVFKVSKGRGLFGDKVTYQLYVVQDAGQPVFNSEHKNLLLLSSKVGTLYR